MDAAGGEQLSLAAVRDALVRLEDSVVFALIERARHPRNAAAYAPGAGGDAGGRSLVEFFVREAEALNAKASLFFCRASLVPSVCSIEICISQMENPVEQRRGQNYFFFQIMEFSGLTQPSNIISSNAGLTGESKKQN